MAADWVSRQTIFTTIYTRPGEEAVAGGIGTMADEEVIRIAGFLDLRAVARIPIYAYTSELEFQRDAGPRPLLLGVSYTPSGIIRVDVTGNEGPIRQVLAHELTHSLIGQKVGLYHSELPDWVNEGIAGLLSLPLSPESLRAAGRYRPYTGILSREQLETAFESQTSLSTAYQQSQSMLAWLEIRHPGAIQRMLTLIREGQTFDGALDDATGTTVDDWLDGWRSGTSSLYFWLNLLASPIVFAPLALAAIIAVFLHRRRKDQAEEEIVEPEEDDGDFSSMVKTRNPDLARFPIWDDIQTP